MVGSKKNTGYKKTPTGREKKANKKSVMFRGKNVYYTNIGDLTKKLNISKDDAKKLIFINKHNSDTTRIATTTYMNRQVITKFDIVRDDTGVLKRKFGIDRIQNKKLISSKPVSVKNTIIQDSLKSFESARGLRLNINIYVVFYYDISYDDIKYYKRLLLESREENNGVINLKDVNKSIDHEIAHRKIDVLYQEGNVFKNYIIKNDYVDNIKNTVRDLANEYVNTSSDRANSLILTTYTIRDAYSKNTFKLRDGVLRNNPVINVKDHIFDFQNITNIVNYMEETSSESCIIQLMNKYFPHVDMSRFKSSNRYGVTVNEIMRILKSNKIDYTLYEIDGSVIDVWFHEEPRGTIHLIVHNNHAYPLSSNIIKYAKKDTFEKIKFIKDGNKKFTSFLHKDIEPKDVKLLNITSLKSNQLSTDIVSFIVNDTKYIDNPEWELCNTLLTKLGLQDKMTDNMQYTSVFNIVADYFIPTSTYSFLPDSKLYVPVPYNYYTTSIIDTTREITTIDKTFCYTCSLHMLPALIYVDWRTADVFKYNNEPILDYNMYICDPKESTILMDNLGLYPGYYVKYCQNHIQLKVLEGIQCNSVQNGYVNTIDHFLENMDRDTFKFTINKIIGCFELSSPTRNVYEYKSVYNEDFKSRKTGYYTVLDDEFSLRFEPSVKLGSATSKIPIKIQLMCQSRILLFEKIKELNLDSDDIIKINTDSITYYGKPPKNVEKAKTKNIYSWKIEDNKLKRYYSYIQSRITKITGLDYEEELQKIQAKYDKLYSGKQINELVPERIEYITSNLFKLFEINKIDPLDCILPPAITKFNINQFSLLRKQDSCLHRVLHNRYAGSGKTYQILNEIIPQLEKENKDYIILTTTHKSCETYKMHKLKCDVIQKYTLQRILPKEKFIIIDEFGMVDKDGHDLLCILSTLNYEYSVWGDFKQLLPFGMDEPFGKKHYYNWIFNKIDSTFVNKRNNFTKQFYDSIGKDNMLKLVKKYSSPIEDAELILCYRTSKTAMQNTCEIYNNKMLKHYGHKSKYAIGTKHIVTTNKFYKEELLPSNKDEPIFLSKTTRVEIIGYENKTYIIQTNAGYEYEIPSRTMKSKHFNLGYCVNVHQIQGETLNSYHWAEDDDEFMTPRVAYVVISRLKQEKI